MTPKEANKIIAEYMGWEISLSYLPSESLDILVPVWEKMEQYYPEFCGILAYLYIEKDNNGVTLSSNLHHTKQSQGFSIEDDETGDYPNSRTIQEAAAIATAKAIQQL